MRAAAPTAAANRKPSSAGLAAALVFAATLALFSRALTGDFIALDDPTYVVDNAAVAEGLSPATLGWCLVTPVAGNWHPLTMLSHLVDGQLFGLRPWGHHLTSVIWHAANAALLLGVLWRMTGQLWPSAVAALLFAWHPLRVESVAWVSERKDVLSTFFWLATIWLYVDWVRRPAPLRYAAVCLSLALGLAAKAMLVTLPCALVLLDAWPLARLAGWPGSRAGWVALARRLGEKLPLFGLAAAAGAITLWAQRESGAIFSALDWKARLFNALASTVAYLRLQFWPQGLYLPRLLAERTFDLPTMLAAAALLAAISAVAAWQFNRRPYLAVGWFWYLGTLVPVSGLATQQGYQAMADRFTYVPGIGLAIALAWGLDEWAAQTARRRPALDACLAVVLVILATLTWRQLGYWRDSQTLFEHTLALAPGNDVALAIVGHELARQGKPDEAREKFLRALALFPDNDDAHRGLGRLAIAQMHLEEAVYHFVAASRLAPRSAVNALNAAQALSLLGLQTAAAEEARRALALDPQLAANPQAAEMLAAIAQGDRTRNALDSLQRALERQPDDAVVLNRLARILATHPRPAFRDPAQAERLARRAAELTDQQHPLILDTLAAALAERKHFAEAQQVAQQAAELAAAWARRDSAWERLPAEIDAHRARYAANQPLREDPDQASFWIVRIENP